MCIHSYSAHKLTIRMVHVHIVLHCHSLTNVQTLVRKFVNATQVDSYHSSSYSLSLLYSEHDNTQLVCNKQWYVESQTFYL